MSKTTMPAEQTGAAGKPLVPPEERFWQRYSPHHEAPLSGFSSLFLHGAILVLVAVVAYYLDRRLQETEKPLAVAPIVMAQGGGFGDSTPGETPRGENEGTKEAVPAQPPASEPPAIAPPLPKTPVPDVRAEQLPVPPSKQGPDTLLADVNQTLKQASGLSKEMQEKLQQSMAPRPAPAGDRSGKEGGKDAGKGGKQGTGKDTGKDGGEGSGFGPDVAKLRVERQRRWTLYFNTFDGKDYLRQLAALGAILAIPQPDGQFFVIRDLHHMPARGKPEDVSQFDRIFFGDDRRDSVRQLAGALGINPPPQILAYFPVEVEKDMLRKELEYGKRHGRKHESDIRETHFKLNGSGKKVTVYVDHQN